MRTYSELNLDERVELRCSGDWRLAAACVRLRDRWAVPPARSAVSGSARRVVKRTRRRPRSTMSQQSAGAAQAR